MANKENQAPAHTPPLISSISPSNKPALSRQRDHSACRRPETPLKVRKTRENLKQHGNIYADVPPPCTHSPLQHFLPHQDARSSSNMLAVRDTNRLQIHKAENEHGQISDFTRPDGKSVSAASGIQRQKSASRRMLSRVKNGIANRSKAVSSIRPTDSDTSLVRRLSGRRKFSTEEDRRAQSLEISRDSIDSLVEEMPTSVAGSHVAERSFTDSTVSTAEVFRDPTISEMFQNNAGYFDHPMVLDLSQAHASSPPPSPASPSPHPTPRTIRKISPPMTEQSSTCTLLVPCVTLDVFADHTMVDVETKKDIWIATKATVQTKSMQIPASSLHEVQRSREADEVDCGTISSLRLCFKPVGGSRIRSAIGRKTLKDVRVGQCCELFTRLRLPRIATSGSSRPEPDQDSLFAELESIVGTLETEVLHVEARYRHSMLPSDNVVTVRQVCKVRRPKMESRWSLIDALDRDNAMLAVQKRLARYLAAEFPPEQALELMDGYLNDKVSKETEVLAIRQSLMNSLHQEEAGSTKEPGPAVVITDMDQRCDKSVAQRSDQSTMESNLSVAMASPSQLSLQFTPSHKRHASSSSLLTIFAGAPPLISAPRTTTALSIMASPSKCSMESHLDEPYETEDKARQLWRHIRRSSLSAKQLQQITVNHAENLEVDDEALRELRGKALANKRSVGAETLKGWKWEDNVRNKKSLGEAPWM